MRNFGKLGRALLAASASALSVSISACSSSSGKPVIFVSTDGASNGADSGTGIGDASGRDSSPDSGDAPGTGGMTGDGGTDSNDTTDPQQVHLTIINQATTGGIAVTRPAPPVSYNTCRM